MAIPADVLREEFSSLMSEEYEHAVVYSDFDQETILHEGELRILANGWVELPTGRLVSPEAIHHIDT